MDAESDEVVLYAPDTGIISEGLSSYFFLLSGNTLYKTMTGVIVGTVRAMVLDAAQEMGLAIEPVLTVADVTGLARVDVSSLAHRVTSYRSTKSTSTLKWDIGQSPCTLK